MLEHNSGSSLVYELGYYFSILGIVITVLVFSNGELVRVLYNYVDAKQTFVYEQSRTVLVNKMCEFTYSNTAGLMLAVFS